MRTVIQAVMVASWLATMLAGVFIAFDDASPEPECPVAGNWSVSEWRGGSGSMAFATSGKYAASGAWGEWTGKWTLHPNKNGKSLLCVEEVSAGGTVLQWSVLLEDAGKDAIEGTLAFPDGSSGKMVARREKP